MPVHTSRREFLIAAASASRVLGANDRIRVGIIGAGGRGQGLMRDLNQVGGIEWVAVSDVYDVRRDKAAAIAEVPVKKYLDYRELLAHKDIDAVIVATPDHWHAQATIDACRAGKDVYVEKPMTSKPEQGPAIVQAVRETNRIVAVGTQQRTGLHYIEAKQKIIEAGLLGKIGLVRTWYDANNGYVQTAPPGMEKKPEGLDWNRWLGWLPKIPWDPERYFSPFKWMDIGGGQVAGIFIHVIDTVHWYLNLDKPSAVVAGGGIYQFKDGRDTPDVINLILEYPQELNVTFEGEILTCREKYQATAGMEFHGTGGVLTVLRYSTETGYEYVPNPKNSKAPPLRGPGVSATAVPHLKLWLECIRTRQKHVSNEVTGHYSAMACHMGNLAWKNRARILWDRKWDV